MVKGVYKTGLIQNKEEIHGEKTYTEKDIQREDVHGEETYTERVYIRSRDRQKERTHGEGTHGKWRNTRGMGTHIENGNT